MKEITKLILTSIGLLLIIIGLFVLTSYLEQKQDKNHIDGIMNCLENNGKPMECCKKEYYSEMKCVEIMPGIKMLADEN